MKIRRETVHEGTPAGTPELHKGLIVTEKPSALHSAGLQGCGDMTPVGGFGQLHAKKQKKKWQDTFTVGSNLN